VWFAHGSRRHPGIAVVAASAVAVAVNVTVSTDAKRMTLVHQRVVGAPGRIAVLEFVPPNCWLRVETKRSSGGNPLETTI